MSGDEETIAARRLAHLEERIAALARDQRHLRRLLFELAAAQEVTVEGGIAGDGPAASAGGDARDDEGDAGPLWRAGRFLLRRSLGVARRAWQTSDPDRADRPRLATAEPATALPTLAVVAAAADAETVAGALALQTLPPDRLLVWDRAAATVEVRHGDLARPGEQRAAPGVAELRRLAACDFVASAGRALGAPNLGAAGTTLLELARLALAAEDLLFLELPCGREEPPLLVVRPQLWQLGGDDGTRSTSGWDEVALGREVRRQPRQVVGRVVGATWQRRPEADLPLRLLNGRVVVTRGYGPVRHRVAPLDRIAPVATIDDGRPSPLLWVLAAGPFAGRDRLAAAAVRAVAFHPPVAPPSIVSLKASDAVAARRLGTLAATTDVYPAGDLLPAEVSASAVAALAALRPGTRILDPTTLGAAERLGLVGIEVPGTAGHDAERRRGLRHHLGLDPAATVVAWRGDLVPELRPEDVVALAAAAADAPDLAFVCAGEGPMSGTLADLVALLRPPRLIVTAALATADLAAVADLALSTAEDDALPYPVLEAMAAGLPAVVTPGSALAAALAAIAPDLVAPTGDLPALRRAIERLRDPELRRRRGAACRELVVERFAAAAAEDRLRQLLAGS